MLPRELLLRNQPYHEGSPGGPVTKTLHFQWRGPLFFLIFKHIYLFLAALGLCCCLGSSVVGVSRGCALVAVRGLLIVVASLVAEHGL